MSTNFDFPPGVRVIPNSLTSGGASNPNSCEGKLDQFSLTASQHYNFGNVSNWFFSFRFGMSGVSERLGGLQVHSTALHEWTGTQSPIFIYHHVAVMLFCMYSAMECFTFLVIALGLAFVDDRFRNISTLGGLRCY